MSTPVARADAVAGVSVCAVPVPEAVAYAVCPPSAGLGAAKTYAVHNGANADVSGRAQEYHRTVSDAVAAARARPNAQRTEEG